MFGVVLQGARISSAITSSQIIDQSPSNLFFRIWDVQPQGLPSPVPGKHLRHSVRKGSSTNNFSQCK